MGLVTWGTWPGRALAALVLSGVGATGCGGSRPAGEPASLDLYGQRIPTDELKAQYRAQCGLARRAHDDPASAETAFYGGGPHDSMHLLAAILAQGHKAESSNLLNVMLTFEHDIGLKPPPPSTGADADALTAAAANGLRVEGVTPPAC